MKRVGSRTDGCLGTHARGRGGFERRAQTAPPPPLGDPVLTANCPAQDYEGYTNKEIARELDDCTGAATIEDQLRAASGPGGLDTTTRPTDVGPREVGKRPAPRTSRRTGIGLSAEGRRYRRTEPDGEPSAIDQAADNSSAPGGPARHALIEDYLAGTTGKEALAALRGAPGCRAGITQP